MRLAGEYQRDETPGARFSDPHDGQNGLLARPTALLGDRLSVHAGIHRCIDQKKRSSLLSGPERLFIIGWIITSETSQSGRSHPGLASSERLRRPFAIPFIKTFHYHPIRSVAVMRAGRCSVRNH